MQIAAALLLGFIFHRIFFESGLAGEVWELVAGVAQAIYQRIGIVSVGLFPLSLYLFGLSIFISLHHLDIWVLRSNARDKLV